MSITGICKDDILHRGSNFNRILNYLLRFKEVSYFWMSEEYPYPSLKSSISKDMGCTSIATTPILLERYKMTEKISFFISRF